MDYLDVLEAIDTGDTVTNAQDATSFLKVGLGGSSQDPLLQDGWNFCWGVSVGIAHCGGGQLLGQDSDRGRLLDGLDMGKKCQTYNSFQGLFINYMTPFRKTLDPPFCNALTSKSLVSTVVFSSHFSFSYSWTCYQRFELSICDVIVAQKKFVEKEVHILCVELLFLALFAQN